MNLRIFEELPEGFLVTAADGLAELLGGPSLIHLPGNRGPALFLSILLHGNETIGLDVLKAVLRQQRGREGPNLPRALSIFVGNVQAAGTGVRRLEGQPDFNRVWPGSDDSGTPEHEVMRNVVDNMKSRGIWASIDIHTNTGSNPHYACVNRLDDSFLHLATLFSRTVVYFTKPKGVQSAAMAELCPSVTIEAGKAGDPHGIEHATEFVLACLHLAEIPAHPVAPHDADLFHTVATVKVPSEVTFSFADGNAQLRLDPALERANFAEIGAGTTIGEVSDGTHVPLDVSDEEGRDVAARYFGIVNGRLTTRRDVMPSMVTLDEKIIRQDCLCYLMERYDLRDRSVPQD